MLVTSYTQTEFIFLELQQFFTDFTESLKADYKKISGRLPQSDWLKALIESSHDAFVASDEEGRILAWNDRAEKMFGWSKAEVLNHSVFDTIFPDECKKFRGDQIRQLQNPGESPYVNRLVELELVHANGKRIPVAVRVVPFKGGGKYTFCTFIHDISERIKKEKVRDFQYSVSDLILSHLTPIEVLSRILKLMVDHFEWDYGEIWVQDNEDLVRSIGYPEDVLPAGVASPDKNETLAQIVSSVRREKWMHDLSRYPHMKEVCEKGFRSAVGLPIHFGIRCWGAITLYSRGPLERDSVLLDAYLQATSQLSEFIEKYENERLLHTGYQKLEAQVLESNRQLDVLHQEYARLVEAIPQGVWTCSSEGFADYCNERLSEYTGMSVESMKGRGWVQAVYPAHVKPLVELWRNQSKLKKGFETEYLLRRGRDGAYRWHLVKALPILNDSGEIEKWIGTCTDIDEQKQKSESLRAVITNLPVVLWAVDEYGIFTLSEGSALASLGLKPDEVVGQSAFVVYKDHAKIVEAIRKSLMGEEIRFQSEINGLWFENHCQPLKDFSGRVIGVIGVAVDISERVAAEKRLAESESKYRLLFDLSPRPMWVYDLESSRFLAVNKAAVDRYGYSREEFFNLTVFDLWRPQAQSEEFHEGFTRHITKSGEIFFVEVQSHEIEVNGRHGRLVLTEDVTDRVEYQKKMAEHMDHMASQQKWLEEIMDMMPTPFVLLERETARLSFANKAAHRLAGGRFPVHLNIENGEGEEYCFLSPDRVPYSKGESPWYRAIRGERLEGLETCWKTPAGIRELLIYCDFLPSKHGHSPVIVVALQDIEKLKLAELELTAAKKASEAANSAKSQFLASMSHEIRTPLSAILGFAHLLLDPDIDPNEHNRFLEIIIRNGRELSRLINDILDISKIEAGRLDIECMQISLPNLLSEVQALFFGIARKKNIELHFHMEAHTPSIIYSDPTRLRQVLVNVVGNAVKFTETGEVRMTTTATSLEEGSHKIEFYVQDTGPGIAAEDQGKLFGQFSQADAATTRKYGGTGLGLALSKSLAHALGGDVSLVESQKGKGSTFKISIRSRKGDIKAPVDKADSHELKPEAHSDRLRNIRMLLVDDAIDNRLLFKKLLANQGAQVDVAENGTAAIDKIRTHDYDVVLMDLQMPEMDGFEALRILRSEGFKVPVIALTAHAMKEDRERSLKMGFNAHLTKPTTSVELVRTVLNFTNRTH